jgi:predicted ArsR family transcriptional regulator
VSERIRSNRNEHQTDGDPRFRLRSRALGDPTRYGIYRHIARRERPVSIAELTGEFTLNHNTVRQHLKKLCDAGLVEVARDAPRGPGRPRLLYRLSDEAASEWNDEGPYERLSLLLLEVATTGADALEVGRAAGRSIHLDVGAEDPVAAMTAAMAAQGFAPQVATGGEHTEVVLRHCPFASAAEANPGIVCDLHRGMLEGLSEQLVGIASPRLIAHDPRLGRCGVHLEVSVD